MRFFNQFAAKSFRAIFTCVFYLAFAAVGAAQTPGLNCVENKSDGVFLLTAACLHSPWEGELDNAGWRYRAGDDANWAAADFDDRDWEKLDNTQLDPARLPSAGWNGAAWFRLRIKVDERLRSEPVALRLVHWGASEIYLDGKLLKRFGTIAAIDKGGVLSDEVERNPRGIPVAFTFETGGEHVVAVRYSLAVTGNSSSNFAAWLMRGRFSPGLSVSIQTANGAIVNRDENTRGFGDYKLFIGILYSFALLHFLLFFFYRVERTNLFYSLFAFSLANGILANNIVNGGNQTTFVSAIFFMIFAFNYGASFVALQAFLYEAFQPRFSKFFRFNTFLLVLQLIIILISIRHRSSFYATSVLVIISLADSLRIVVSAVRRRREGAWIIAGGVLILAFGITLAILREFQMFQDLQIYAYVSDFALVLGFPTAVSIYLARNFARTNRHLEAQLVQVKEFAEKEVEYERNEARLLIVEAENERQAKELEEARQLQLSMLPKKLPQIANLEIAAYMKPATEVGGDYYDFHVGADGTLTVAVGDATGHGLKAGTVVTATKGLFNNLAHAPDISDTFKQISGSLKAMNLRGLFMAMTMLKIKGNRALIAMAGMPTVLIYRAQIEQVEEIAIRAMPLGSFSKAAYVSLELSLSAGDSVVIMSDGFPEMFNEAGEMLADDAAKNLLSEVALKSPQEIINRFVEAGETWAGTRPPDDDVTFVVLKIKTDAVLNL